MIPKIVLIKTQLSLSLFNLILNFLWTNIYSYDPVLLIRPSLLCAAVYIQVHITKLLSQISQLVSWPPSSSPACVWIPGVNTGEAKLLGSFIIHPNFHFELDDSFLPALTDFQISWSILKQSVTNIIFGTEYEYFRFLNIDRISN